MVQSRTLKCGDAFVALEEVGHDLVELAEPLTRGAGTGAAIWPKKKRDKQRVRPSCPLTLSFKFGPLLCTTMKQWTFLGLCCID